jgi:hypothetical protein
MVFNDGHYLQADGYYRAVNVLDVIPAYEEFTAESGHGENSAQQVPMAGRAALK